MSETISRPAASRSGASRSAVSQPVPGSQASVEIETQRLLLRGLCTGDLGSIVTYAGNRAVATMTARIPHPYTAEHARDFLAAQALSPDGFGALAITGGQDGAFLGCIGLAPLTDGSAELGYWIGEPFWRQGYATEAARAMIDHAFSTLEVAAIEGRTRVTNEASRKVLERCGLRYVNSGLSAASARGGAVPVDYFRLARRDWESFKAWRPASVRPLPAIPAAGTALARPAKSHGAEALGAA